MPQLDISFYIPQLFWLLMIFGGLYLVMAYVVLPKLEHSIKSREKSLGQLQLRTQELEKEVENLRCLNEAKIKAEHDRSLEQISNYTQKWKQEAQKKEAELQILMHKRLSDLYEALQAQQAEALHALKDKEQELVALVVEHLTGVEMPKQSVVRVLKKVQTHETIH